MANENNGEELNLRLDFGAQPPDLIFRVGNCEGVAIEHTLNGSRHLDALLKEAGQVIEKTLPIDLLVGGTKERLLSQFRLGFYYLLQHP